MLLLSPGGVFLDFLWRCGVVYFLFYVLHEIKISEKEFGIFNCQHQSSSTEAWLVLSVITNACGWMILASRFFEFPHSWFTTVVFINTFRLIFRIKSTMPIILDLGISLILQWIISLGPFGLKWAFGIVSSLITMIFYNGYFGPHFAEYTRLIKDNPEARPLVHPLSPLLLAASMFDIYIVNGCLLLIGWFYPWNDRFYRFYQDHIGYVLVKESVIFLTCYKDLCSKREGMIIIPKIPKPPRTGKQKSQLRKQRDKISLGIWI